MGGSGSPQSTYLTGLNRTNEIDQLIWGILSRRVIPFTPPIHFVRVLQKREIYVTKQKIHSKVAEYFCNSGNMH